MIVAATGHRPKDITENFDLVTLKARLKMQGEATRLICGMAAGFDLCAGLAAIELDIPITAARPWNTHTVGKLWIADYTTVMAYADIVHVVTDIDHYTGPWLLHDRNHWMVDHCDAVIAYWNPSKNSGGTFQCIEYTKKVDKPLANIFFDPPF